MPDDKKTAYMSGFCGIGSHEGTRPKSPSGVPMKTCNPVLTYMGKTWNCGCRCHSDLDKMFEMTGMERTLQENPEYIPAKITAWMPSPEERLASSIAASPVPTRIIESPAPALAPATVARDYTPTASGRAGRGQLELWVKLACDEWLLEMPEDRCTPGWLSRKIAAMQGVGEPSQGAIDSVLKRWVGFGFATMGSKPTRFTGYTVEGIKVGLEVLKMRSKQRERYQQAASKRGER